MLRPSPRQLRKWRRERLARRVILWGVAGLLGLIAAIFGFGYWRENIARANEPAAVVAGETITVAQLLERVRPRAQALDAQARLYEAQGIAQAATQINLQRSRLPDQVLDQVIEDRLVRAEAARRDLSVPDDDAETRIRKEIAEQEALNQPRPTPTPSPAPVEGAATPEATPAATPTSTVVPTLTADAFETAYRAFLTRANISDEYYRELIRADLYREELKESMATDIPKTEEQVNARHILVDDDETLQRARQLLADGIPFDQVAQDLSTDPGSRDKGGALGWFGRGTMNAPFEQAAFNQPVGLIGEPVQSPNGIHIIQVLERDAERPLSAEQIEQRSNQAYQAWFAGVKGGPEVQNQLTPERRSWVLRQLGNRRAA